MRVRLASVYVSVFLLTVVGCAEENEGANDPVPTSSDDSHTPGYGAADFADGIDLTVSGDSGIIDRAVAFHPSDSDELSHEQMERLASGDSVLSHEGIRGFDVVVVYRTGPYCGLLPSVDVASNDRPVIEVTPRAASEGTCESMEFDEAVGFKIAHGFDPDELDVIVHQ
ncbi:hypothetical protein G1H11_01590 [Phytoactinopolyspora alkaliphila]|uniref:Lipoprotein n=1 Tax=Phytoactinopolyspora alkaliphila TaxID=1783498 RepID=A0A6N9YGB6_9ACTN|nr:hypothetical protein [Phytoactinopolyspora alkaliphila]NED94004.1 hypothetical protein [Phytoactinopolyspora alkaliphila]